MAEESSKRLRKICQSDGKRTRRESMEDMILRAVERVTEEEVGTGGWASHSERMTRDQQEKRGHRDKANIYL